LEGLTYSSASPNLLPIIHFKGTLKSSTAHFTATILRRSLQLPDPNKPYLINGHDMTHKIEQAIKKDNYSKLCNIAIEIRIEIGNL
ncbi:hypothetical protein FocTR4_00010655, partial [Fusarium oxysporum f. sp. cubense]